MRVGSGQFVYEEVKGWGNLPEGWSFDEVPDVAVDSEDRLYVLTRGKHPVIVLDREGRFLTTWGEGAFVRPHGLFIDRNDVIYIIDDRGHALRKFTPDGRPLWSMETADHPADTGYIINRSDTVLVAGPPFNRPTGVALSPTGDMFVSDGYGNARIHKFSAEGQLLLSWGEPGSGPGQFCTPHDVCIDRNGLVYVADRMNLRIQVFDQQGEFITEWRNARWPNSICLDKKDYLYVAEAGGPFFEWPTIRLDRPPARVTVRDLSGKILAELGEKEPLRSGLWFVPHGIAVDSHGDLYVGEVTVTQTHGLAPTGWSVLRKYIRA